MKKRAYKEVKVKRVVLALAALCGLGFGGIGSVGAYSDEDISDLANRIQTLENQISNGNVQIGTDAQSTSGTSVAIGNKAESHGQGVAIGNKATVSNDETSSPIAIGGTYLNDEAAEEDRKAATATGCDAIAIGAGSYAQGNWSIAHGGKSAAYGYGSIAIGQKATAGESTLEAWPNTDAIAIGDEATASKNDTVAIGRQAKSAAEEAIAIGKNAEAGGEASIAVGEENRVWGSNAIAIGQNAIAGYFSNDSTQGENSIAIGNQAWIATAKNAVAIGASSVATEDNTFSVGSDGSTFTITDDEGKEHSITTATVTRRIVNVANGTKSTDAATYGQLLQSGTYDASTGTITFENNAGETAFSVTGITAGGSSGGGSGSNVTVDDVTLQMDTNGKISAKTGDVSANNNGLVTGAKVYEKVGDTSKLSAAGLGETLTDSVISVNNRMDSFGNEINKVGAGAAALAALHPEGFNPNDKLSFAFGYGHYRNANAGALGAFYKPNRDTTVSFASTIGNGNPMMNIGVSFKLGRRGEGVGVYSSNAEMAREMNALRMQNAEQAAKIENLEADNALMKADNEELRAQIAMIMKKLELSETVEKSAAK